MSQVGNLSQPNIASNKQRDRRQITRSLWWLHVTTALTLVVLLIHVHYYWFLCDDAFISFRYADNLVQGRGLVFNPGAPSVEGYTNFLWVILMAAFAVVKIPPEQAANVTALGATVGVWGLVAWYACRTRPTDERAWLAVMPLLLLGITRSFAVWATSGLETRLFELLVVGAVMRLTVEVRNRLAQRPSWNVAGLFLAFATLTRPDGLLVSFVLLSVAAGCLTLRKRLTTRFTLVQGVPFLLLVGAHFLFRRWYYGDWLPNTYYAKVDGQTWWPLGWMYLAAFALEYAAYLWAPLLVAGVIHCCRQGRAIVPATFLTLVGVHALYVASIGGDHFEYRPLTLYYPLLYLVMYEGACLLARGNRWRLFAVGAYIALVAGGIIWLPAQSHRQFRDLPQDRTRVHPWWPDQDPIYRWWPLRAIGAGYRELLDRQRSCAANIRQEEHARLVVDLIAEGRQLARLVKEGRLPADTLIALDGVGAVPYYSGLPTLDRLGLNDHEIARQPFLENRMVAHGKRASWEYARSKGVDLWASDATHLLLPITDSSWPDRIQRAAFMNTPQTTPEYVADLGDGWWLLTLLPQGLEHTSKRLPNVSLCALQRREVQTALLQNACQALRRRLDADPRDVLAALTLARALLIQRQYAEGVEVMRATIEHVRDDQRLWATLAAGLILQNKVAQATEAIQTALTLAEQHRETLLAEQLRQQLRRLADRR